MHPVPFISSFHLRLLQKTLHLPALNLLLTAHDHPLLTSLLYHPLHHSRRIHRRPPLKSRSHPLHPNLYYSVLHCQDPSSNRNCINPNPNLHFCLSQNCLILTQSANQARTIQRSGKRAILTRHLSLSDLVRRICLQSHLSHMLNSYIDLSKNLEGRLRFKKYAHGS